MYTNHVEAAEVRLQDAERGVNEGVSEDQARVIRGQAATIRAAVARISGDLALCVALARQALDLLPEPDVVPLKLRATAALSASRAYQVSGDVTPDSERSVASVVAPLRVSGNRFASLLSMTNLARLRVMQGKLRQARATYEEAMQVVSESGEMQALVGGPTYYFGMGDLHREWNDLDAAQSHLKQGMELVKGSLTVDADTILMGYLSMARLQQALGDGNGALATLEELAQLAQQRNFVSSLLARAAAAKARACLAQGDLIAAVRWAETSGLRADDEPNYLKEGEHLVLARVLIVEGRNDASGRPLDDALGLLDRLLQAAEKGDRTASTIEILTLQALALHARNEPSETAFTTLERALTLAEPEGYVRIFVDEGAPMAALLSELLAALRKRPRKGLREAHHRALLDYALALLTAFESPHTSTELSPLDPLTTREREVLQLIAEGLSNQEIAARLFIASSTAKGYVHTILRKLEVESRTKAVARARELHLV